MKIKRFNESINSDKVVIKDEYLEDIINYIDGKISNQLASLGFLGQSISGIFKGRVATTETNPPPKSDYDYWNEKLSTLHYNIKGEDIDIKFPTKKLVSAEDYEMYSTANKYNL